MHVIRHTALTHLRILFPVYAGVYKYSYGRNVGRHAVKIIGWGVENNVPYW